MIRGVPDESISLRRSVSLLIADACLWMAPEPFLPGLIFTSVQDDLDRTPKTLLDF